MLLTFLELLVLVPGGWGPLGGRRGLSYYRDRVAVATRGRGKVYRGEVCVCRNPWIVDRCIHGSWTGGRGKVYPWIVDRCIEFDIRWEGGEWWWGSRVVG